VSSHDRPDDRRPAHGGEPSHPDPSPSSGSSGRHEATGPPPGPSPPAAAPGGDAEGELPELEPHQVFAAVGGYPAFERLVDAFYGRVAQDDLLRPMYPEDLEPGKTHLTMFLAQYWGGGDIYSSQRGHPRLRMRHASFPITPEAALRWAELMSASIHEQRDWPEDARRLLLAYVARATPTLINQLPEGVATLPRDEPPPP
jgi:hemoglobin